MGIALFDTNILIDVLKGYQPAIDELEYWNDPVISVITWIEVLAGAKPSERSAILEFLADLTVIHTDNSIMSAAAEIRATSIAISRKIALPDAIIVATAAVHDATVITRNKKDFLHWNVRIPYELSNTTPVSFINIVPPPGPPRINPYPPVKLD